MGNPMRAATVRERLLAKEQHHAVKVLAQCIMQNTDYVLHRCQFSAARDDFGAGPSP
jgi:hypothetical protein